MTITCIVCKKEPIPFDDSRSFHKFPKDNDLKTKWMNAIGKFSIKKTAKICSDHFDTESYHNTDGYTTLRRLLSTAVPRLISSKELLLNVTNNFTETNDKTVSENIQTTESHLNNKIIEENEISHSEKNSKGSESIVNIDNANLISQSTVANSNDKSDDAKEDYPSLSISPLETTEHTPYNDFKITQSHIEIIKRHHHRDNHGNSNNLKRKNPFKSKANYNEKKKICHRVNFKTFRFTREKFSSDEAWAEFQEFSTFMKNKIAAVAKKNSRKQKKLTNLKMKCGKYLSTNYSQTRHMREVHGFKKTGKTNKQEMSFDDVKPEIQIDNLHETSQNDDSEEDYMNCIDLEVAAPIVQLTEYENLKIIVNHGNEHLDMIENEKTLVNNIR